jgi:hypothetical protein
VIDDNGVEVLAPAFSERFKALAGLWPSVKYRDNDIHFQQVSALRQ